MTNPHRYFITGTDTDVGKTRVAASLARALRERGHETTVVKLVQTGLPPGLEGDAAHAGRLAGTRHVELARFQKAADPWSAALSENAPLVRVGDLAPVLEAIQGAVVVEGAGGMMVPLNSKEHFGHLAERANLETIVVVGLRMGCLNHALLTLSLCEHAQLPVTGVVLVERWQPVDASYLADVERTLQDKARILGIMFHCEDEASAVADGAHLFAPLAF
ncbi:MAG: dethiobiotin synthase [Candidatus Eremiobacteraeota bacterium]|nr:dethiobiotin synthase [Candidatus Eremiobacteraeota bacterium]